MNRTVIASLVFASLLLAGGLAFAQSSAPDAGVAADEAFSPGPGGGETADAGDGRPPLESTGLEDSVGGSCGCRVAGERTSTGFLLFGSALAAVGVARRRSRKLA